MSLFSAGLAIAIRSYCDLECKLDRTLIRLGYSRRYFSQKGQDRWLVRHVFAGRRGGYFVDVGAGNGVSHSNTYVLERDFGWTGILVEANPQYANAIRNMRTAICVNACVDSTPREIDFLCYGYLGGIICNDTDNTILRRRAILQQNAGNIMRLPTMRLDDILHASGAPSEIDYLSIDVEGAEDRVLCGLSFSDFKIKAITIERPTLTIHNRLISAGFVLAKYRLWDGFYLSGALAGELQVRPHPFLGTRKKLF
jgi:FkbM family methyltransferase